MRLSVLPVLLAGAGFAVQHVGAVPLRVIVVTTKQDVTIHRPSFDDPNFAVASIVRPFGHTTTVTNIDQPGAGRIRHMCGSLASQAARKSAAIAAMFREAFGFSVPEHDLKSAAAFSQPKVDDGRVHILPFGTPIAIERPTAIGGSNFVEGQMRAGERHHYHHLHGMSHRMGGSFVARVNHALVSLGTWEGRIVAFVLGCGIGVLLRMFWVLALVTVRAFRGKKTEEDTLENEHDTVYYEGVILFEGDQDAEVVTLPPPQYDAKEAAPPAFQADEKTTEQN